MGAGDTERPTSVASPHRKRWWPQLRAALLALHVVAIVLLSFPGGSKLGNKRRWKEQRTQAQFAMWGDTLRGWGVTITNEELEAKLWDAAQTYLRAREVVTAPFRRYGNFAPQGWGMFKAPPRRPSALAIDVHDGTAWRTVHRSRSREHDYLAYTLENNRFRKQVGRVARDKKLFQQVATWLARRTFEDLPDAKQVRVRVIRLQSLPPAELRAGKKPPEKTERRHVFRRDHFEAER